MHACKNTHARAHDTTHTHTHTLSLSLSHTHTHIHTHVPPPPHTHTQFDNNTWDQIRTLHTKVHKDCTPPRSSALITKRWQPAVTVNVTDTRREAHASLHGWFPASLLPHPFPTPFPPPPFDPTPAHPTAPQPSPAHP